MVKQKMRSISMLTLFALWINIFGHQVADANSGWVRYHSPSAPDTMIVRIKSEKISPSAYRILYKLTGTNGYESIDYFIYDCKTRIYMSEKSETYISGERDIDDERDNKTVGNKMVVDKKISCNDEVGVNLQRYFDSFALGNKKKM